MTETEHLLEIEGISRSFGSLRALDDVNLAIRRNEFFALLGPSGCGKTTLLRILAGFDYPDSGTITLSGQDLLGIRPNRRPVNLMFQSYALFPHMSVEKNVAYGLEREGVPKSEVRARVQEVLTTVGLLDRAPQRPHQLSGGQRQRVALARAIVKRPQLLLLDEPLSALDKQVRAEMQLELKRLQHEFGITFVVVTHDQEEAMSMADRIAVMNEGRIEQVATPVDLYRRPASSFVGQFIGTGNFFHGSRTERGVDVPGVGELPGTGHGEVGGAAQLLVRPESIKLVSEGAILKGTVIDSHFYGGASILIVRVPGLANPVFVRRPGSEDVARHGDLGLSWDAAHGFVLEA